MTRGYYDQEARTWAMRCDKPGCRTEVGPRPSTDDLPLQEFADAGWFIAAVFGDLCPSCVKEEGGLVELMAVRSKRGAAGAPHPLYANKDQSGVFVQCSRDDCPNLAIPGECCSTHRLSLCREHTNRTHVPVSTSTES